MDSVNLRSNQNLNNDVSLTTEDEIEAHFGNDDKTDGDSDSGHPVFVDQYTGKMFSSSDLAAFRKPDVLIFGGLPSIASDPSEYNRNLFASSLSLKPQSLLLPWDRSPVFASFPSPFDSLHSRFQRPNLCSTEIWRTGTSAEQEAAQVRVLPTYPAAVKRLRDMKPSESEDAIRSKGLGRWLLIISACPEASGVGRSMVRNISHLQTDASLNKALEDLCARKSPATILKRAGTLLKYIVHCSNQGHHAFPLNEAQCLEYCQMMEGSSDFSATSISSFRQALNFAGAVFQVDNATAIASNGRISGMCHKKLLTKRMLKQSSVFSIKEIRCFMEIVVSKKDDLHRLFAGHILFCIFSRARWGDHQHISSVEWDVCDQGCFGGFVQGNTRKSKTSITAEQRTRFLPLTAPLWDFLDMPSGVRWWNVWKELRDSLGLQAQASSPFLPAPKVGSGWCDRALSAGEASGWARELLLESGLPNSDLSSHGCKATLLSWCSKFGLSTETRLTLGYHKGNSSDTLLHYSRDALSGPLQELNKVILSVIQGDFNPDNNRACYFPNRAPVRSNTVPRQLTQPISADIDTAQSQQSTEDCITVELDEEGWVAVNSMNELAHQFDEDLADQVSPAPEFDGSMQLSLHQRGDTQPNPLEEVSDSNSSSSQDSDSSIDEEEAAGKALDLRDLNEGILVGCWMHRRLGTLHKEGSVGASKFACGREISAAYVRAATKRFSWTKCLVCFHHL